VSFAPGVINGDFECKGTKGKKITKQSLGKDRFKIGGGFEDDSKNRSVIVDGNFITDLGAIVKGQLYNIETIFKEPVVNDNFVPTITGGTPKLNSGTIITPTVKKGSTKSDLWYQEFTSFAVGWGGLENLKTYKPTALGVERIEQYCVPGTWDPTAFGGKGACPCNVELGTTGLGGTQFEFPLKNEWPYKNYINFSWFESRAMGWGSGQPTGAFIVNGKNYGAKTANRLWTPVLYWVKGDPHPRFGRSQDLFVAKNVSPPHCQVPSKQAKNINDIVLSVPGASAAVINNVKKGGAGGAFIGKAKAGDGSISYFGGMKLSDPASAMLKEMTSRGKQIEWMLTADAGGSYLYVADGERHPLSTTRDVPTVLYWG